MTDERDDSVLLKKIGHQRDHVAFQELYQRYEHYAFSIAMRILGQRSLAEEALQEAFLSIWSSAASYRTDEIHRPRFWIMRIVVNKCLRLSQTQRRQERNANEEATISKARTQLNAPEEMERTELLSALHKKLEQIPAESRLVLTLYYGAGMSQKEIASAVSMPPRTVSFKIQETLKWLRGELTRAKFGSVALSNELMRDACSGGFQPPSDLQARVLQSLTDETKVTSASETGGRFTKTTGLIVIGLFAATCIGLAVNHIAKDPTKTAIPTNQTLSIKSELLQRWDFNQPDLTGLNQIKGMWKHLSQGGPDGSGCMTVPSSSNVRFKINIPVTNLPVRLQFKAKFKQGKSNYLLSWVDQIPQVTLQKFQLGQVVRGKEEWKTYRCFISKQGLEFWHNGILTYLLLTKATNQSNLALHFGNGTSIDDLEIHKVNPLTINYSAPYFKAAEKYAATQSIAPMLIPALCSGPTSTHPEGQIWKAKVPNAPTFTSTQAKTWTFKDPSELLDFAVMEGHWKHIPQGGKNGTGCVEMGKGNSTALFNLNAEQYPFLITVRFRIFDLHKGFPEIIWRPNDVPRQAKFLNAFAVDSKILVNPAKPWIRIKLYVTREYTDYWAQNQRMDLIYNPKSKGAFGSIASKASAQMDALSIRPISAKQLPDLGPFRAAIEKIRTAQKSGLLPLPNFTSPIQGKKVFAVISLKKTATHKVKNKH